MLCERLLVHWTIKSYPIRRHDRSHCLTSDLGSCEVVIGTQHFRQSLVISTQGHVYGVPAAINLEWSKADVGPMVRRHQVTRQDGGTRTSLECLPSGIDPFIWLFVSHEFFLMSQIP